MKTKKMLELEAKRRRGELGYYVSFGDDVPYVMLDGPMDIYELREVLEVMEEARDAK